MRIAGASTTSAPSARSRDARSLAWGRARVTATVTPPSGRPSPSQSSSACSAATGPTTVIDGGWIAAAVAASAIVARVASTVRWPGSVPCWTTAAGSSGDRPAATSCSAMRPSRRTPM